LDPLELLRGRNTHTMADEACTCGEVHGRLPSGLVARLRLPRIRDCLLAGEVPTPILSRTVASDAAEEADDLERRRAFARYQDEIVRRSVVELEGEPVLLSAEAVAEIVDEDYDFIYKVASRSIPFPVAQT